MGELGALFTPGMRHELEERRSKAARREEEGNARDGDLRIDLESGVAVIAVDGPEDDASNRTASNGTASDGTPSDGSASNDTASNDTASNDAAETTATANHANSDLDGDDDGTGGGSPDAKSAEPQAVRPRGKRGMSGSRR